MTTVSRCVVVVTSHVQDVCVFLSVSNSKELLLYSFQSELIFTESPDVEPHSDVNSLDQNHRL